MSATLTTLLDKIEAIRARNNKLWMEIVRIAMEADPERTKLTLGLISANDAEITKFMDKLAKDRS